MLSVFGLYALLMVSSCKKDNVSSLYPLPPFDSAGCKTDNVSYSDSSKGMCVRQVIEAYCTSTCHNNNVSADSSSGIILTNYPGLKEAVDDLHLADAIKQDGAVMPMPRTGEMMDECSLATVLAWIDQGAKDN